jgi:selenocysteine lyase/cysteine desulfurase
VVVGPFMPDAEKLAAVREGLPAVGAGIYLNTPVSGPLPAETARAMADIAEWEVATGRAHRDRADDVAVRIEEAQASLAAILGAGVDAVILTHGPSDALRRAVHAIDWRPGDRFLIVTESSVDADAIRPPIAEVEIDTLELPVDPDPDNSGLLAEIQGAIGATTRLVACPHVSATGRVLPVAHLAAIAHDVGALLVVDGSQAVGAIPVAVDDLAVDIYSVPAWTWLLGPEGIGGLAVRGELRERLSGGRATVAGEFHLPSVVGLARSCGWLSMYVGLEWVFDRSAGLAAAARARLAAIPGVSVLEPHEVGTPTVAFRIARWDAPAALEELGARVFALASALRDADALRIGTAFFNTEDELDRLASAVELLATHTPDSMPPRRQLTIIGGDR